MPKNRETPIAADASPIAANEIRLLLEVEFRPQMCLPEAGNLSPFICGNRRGIGGNRRFQRLTPPSLAAAHFFDEAAARIASSVVFGVIACGSMRTSITAGFPEATQRSNAGPNCAVSSTISPTQPNERA